MNLKVSFPQGISIEGADKHMFRYFGTKASTSTYIADIVQQLGDVVNVADAFGGLGTIGEILKFQGYKVTTCDVLTFPHFFQVSRIECNEVPSFDKLKRHHNFKSNQDILDHLNFQTDSNSWIVEEYSKKRLFFTNQNAEKLAGIWSSIVKWDNAGLLVKKEKAFLITSLLSSMDKVANTAGTYYAHLKQLNRKSIQTIKLEWINVKPGNYLGQAIQGDALEALTGKDFDVLYLDPPYNNRNYARYYHLPETLAGMQQIKIQDSTLSGIPMDDHLFKENIRSAMKFSYIEKIIESVNWNHLIFHYCDNALIPLELIREKLRPLGSFKENIIPALGYTTKKQARGTTHNVFVVSRT